MTIPMFLKSSLLSRMGRCMASIFTIMAVSAFVPHPAFAAEIDEDHTIDVLFVYGTETQTTYGSQDGVKARANALIERTNKAFENSLINGKVRNVAVRKVEYTEAATLDIDLDLLTSKKGTDDPNGAMDEVHEWRDEVGADVVNFIRSKGAAGASGRAWYLSNPEGSPNMAFSVAAGDSFSHELGHNLGGMHDRGTLNQPGIGGGDPGSAIFPYAFGYVMPNNEGTIMSYSNGPLHFSNPEVSYGGYPTGVAEGDPSAADNAKAFNKTIPVVSKYRKFKPGVATPVIFPAGGNYAVEQTVTITCATEEATIRYTLDGSEVSELSPQYTGPFELRYSATVKARGFKGASIPSETATAVFRITYPDTASDVIFTPPAGTYEDSVTVSLTSPTPDATIRYTVNGTDVSEASMAYTKAITLKRDTTIKARAYKFRHNPSQETSAEYVVIAIPQAEKPLVSIEGDLLLPSQGGDGSTYNGPPIVTLTPFKAGDVIRYSIDNSEITEESLLYTGPFTVTRSTNIKARSWRPSHRVSDERLVPITIRPIPVATPRILPNGGNYVNSVSVRLESDTARAYLRYTTDGRDLPDKISIADNDKYPIFTPGTPIVLTQNTTLKVRGYDVDYLPSVQVVSVPFKVRTAESLRDEYGSHIGAGDAHSLFLNTENGELSVAGRNNYGQLGTGNNSAQLTPVNVAINVSVVSTSRDHSLFITKDSVLYGTGRNDYGQLGDGSLASRNSPAAVATDVLLAAAGGYHTLFITNDGVLHAMGRNEYGQLGDGTITNRSLPIYAGCDNAATPVTPVSGVLLAVAGKFHSLYLLGDGELFGMGRNNEGQLGQGNISNYRSPVKVASGAVSVAAGASHTIYLTSNGNLYGTGSNAYGQLGRDPTGGTGVKVVLEPVLIATGVRTIASGDEHVLFVTTSGELYGLGSNAFGQLGISSAVTKWTATPVKIADNVVSADAGGGHTVYTISSGASIFRYSLGDNLYGQLGDGTTTGKDTPGNVPEGAPATAPVLVPGSGSFERSVEVRVTGADAGASIRYIVLRKGDADRDVTLADPSYGTPFTLERTYNAESRENEVVTVKVRAWLGNRVPSAQVVATYTLLPAVEHIAPTITLQPENQVVVRWRPTTFMVSASGAPAPTYQWYFNGNRIIGATGSSHTIERTTEDNVGTYYVIATNGSGNTGSAKSNEVALSLLNPPVFTRQPISQDIFEGGEIHLNVSIVSDSAVGYQWRRDGQEITGATSATLNLPNARVSQSGAYDVVVSNIAGSLTSNSAIVNIRASNGFPVILRRPIVPEFVWIGGSATLSVNASSPAQDPLSYQWYRNGKAIKGATSATYTIPVVSASHAGEYYVAVTNSRGTVRSPDTSAGDSPVTFTPQPPGGLQITRPLPPLTEAALGQPVTLSVEAVVNVKPGEAYAEPVYQWFFNGNAIVDANGPVYTIPGFAANNLGAYSVTVTSGPNTLKSGPTQLAAVNAPQILTQPAENVLEGVAGKGVALSVQINSGGASLIDYQWLIDGVEIAEANEATHQALATGLYSVRVSNGAGVVNGEIAKVKIVGPPLIGTFTATPATQGSVPSALFNFFDVLNKANPNAVPVIANDRVRLEVTLQGGDEPFHYVWLFNGVPLFGAPDSPVFDVTDITSDCTYAVRVSNSVGEAVSKTIAIRVIQPPTIVRHPVGLQLKSREKAVLSVDASGSGQLTYQWYRNGEPINKAIFATYTITSADNNSAGTYWVLVSNYSGIQVKSKEVQVRVENTGSSAAAQAANTTWATQASAVPGSDALSLGTSSSIGISIALPAVKTSVPATPSLKSGNFSFAGGAVNTVFNGAPADLAAGLRIILVGELADSATKTVVSDDSVLEILAGGRLPNGSYTYERTSASAATLTYTITYGDAKSEHVETGVILLNFDTATGGTYILSGQYNGLTATGALKDGALNGLGDFKVEGQ